MFFRQHPRHPKRSTLTCKCLVRATFTPATSNTNWKILETECSHPLSLQPCHAWRGEPSTSSSHQPLNGAALFKPACQNDNRTPAIRQATFPSRFQSQVESRFWQPTATAKTWASHDVPKAVSFKPASNWKKLSHQKPWGLSALRTMLSSDVHSTSSAAAPSSTTASTSAVSSSPPSSPVPSPLSSSAGQHLLGALQVLWARAQHMCLQSAPAPAPKPAASQPQANQGQVTDSRPHVTFIRTLNLLIGKSMQKSEHVCRLRQPTKQQTVYTSSRLFFWGEGVGPRTHRCFEPLLILIVVSSSEENATNHIAKSS